jgi:non-specific serine/threonine protein kinase
MDIVLTEQANIRAALDWALESDPVVGLETAALLEQFWVMQNPFEGTRRFVELLERAANAPPALRGRALRALSGASQFSGEQERAIRALEEGLSIYREDGDEAGELTMLFRLGTAYLNSGEVDRARPLLQESLAGFRRLGKKMGECEASGNLASLELAYGDPELGRELLEQNIELARKIGFTWWEAGKLHDLADYALRAGHLEEAERRAGESLVLARDLADRSGQIYCLGCFATAAAEWNDAQRAGTVWGAIEVEEARAGPVGRGWEDMQRAQYEATLAAVAGPAFEQGRAEGARFSIEDAIEYVLAGRNEAAERSGTVRP